MRPHPSESTRNRMRDEEHLMRTCPRPPGCNCDGCNLRSWLAAYDDVNECGECFGNHKTKEHR